MCYFMNAINKYREERLWKPGHQPRTQTKLSINLFIFSKWNSPKWISFECNVQLATFVLTQFQILYFLGAFAFHSQHPFDALSQVFIEMNTFSFIIRHYSNNWELNPTVTVVERMSHYFSNFHKCQRKLGPNFP